MSAKRFDVFKIDKGEFTTQGFLRSPAYFTRTGVFKYRRADGSWVRELRHPDDVFNADSIETLKMAPLTDSHPPQFINPENFKKYSVGFVGENISKESNKLTGQVVVSDKSAMMKVDTGKVELSCGYTADLVDEKGTYDGEEYDFRQTNIRYNHVALVDRGRAGPQVRLRLDSLDATIEGIEILDEQKENVSMKKTIKLDGKEFEVSEELLAAFTSELKKQDEKNKEDVEKEKLQDKIKELEDELEKMKAKKDSLEEEVKKHQDFDIEGAVKERLHIVKVANDVLGEDVKLDEKSNLDIMKDTIVKKSPKLDLADKTEVYIKARFDAVSEEIEAKKSNTKKVSDAISGKKTDEKDIVAEARKKCLDDAKEAWTKPLAASKK